MDYRIEDTFDTTPERYWEVFFSEAYNAALWPALDIVCEPLVLEKTGEGAGLRIHREQRLTPKRELPEFARSFIKGAITYVEKNDFVAADNAMRTVTIPGIAADRLKTSGIYRLEVVSPTRVKRIWDGVCECKIPLVGGKVEKQLVEEVRESYRRAAAFTRSWLAQQAS